MTTQDTAAVIPRQGFRPRRLAHVNLFVSDLTRSVEFYEKVCGLQVVFEEPGISAIFLSNGTSHHDLALMEITEGQRVGRDGSVQVSVGRGRAAGLNHLGFETASEAALVASIASVRAAGITLHRTVDHQISRSAYLFDRDGIYLEMYCDAKEDWRETYKNNTGQLITGAWDPTAAPPEPEPRWAAEPDITVLETAALRPVRTARASLVVRDLAQSVRFYTEVAGLDVLLLGASGAVLSGGLGLPDVTLLQAGPDDKAGLSSFGLELRDVDELAEGRDRVRRAGVPLLAEVHSDYKDSLVLTDPDGIKVEFLVPGPVPAGRLASPPSVTEPFAS